MSLRGAPLGTCGVGGSAVTQKSRASQSEVATLVPLKPLTYLEKKRMIDSISRMPAHIHVTIFKTIWDDNNGIKYSTKGVMTLMVVDDISNATLRTLYDMVSNYDNMRNAEDRRRKTTEKYAEQMDHLGSDSDPSG